MTAPDGHDTLSAALQALARHVAPEVLAEALRDARAEATSILRRGLVDALLDEAATTMPIPTDPDSCPTGYGEQAIAKPGSVAGEQATRRRGAGAASPADRPTDKAVGAAGVDDGLYVYCITSGPPQRVTGLVGIDRSRTYPIVEDDLIAVVSDVSGQRNRWGIGVDGEPDLELLAPRLQEHEDVLEGILKEGSVLPMRFGTLYGSRDAVSEMLATHGEPIRAVLDRVEGKVEWGLTVTWDSRRAAAALADAGAGAEMGASQTRSPGRAYLSRREADKARAEHVAQQRAQVSADLHHAIDDATTASVVHALAGPQGGDDGIETLMRSSYLVARSDRDRFEAVIVEGLEAGAQLGLSGELTGPWPPYNFSRLQLAGAAV
ncbi:MAG: GvpL/GvpF family gas vesicle protein [Actinomycetota bacterium]|nr:GvpL/GvpF family gas vesicle protein [Actinomycetota bacterium]